MSNDYFKFKQFTIHQDLCAMKVGMDGVTLGAWVSAEKHDNILDIGTGSALIALMLAQRYPTTHVTAIDIDPTAVRQAQDNINASAYAKHIDVHAISIQEYARSTDMKFDIIVTNPPYFSDSFKNPDIHRTTARHTDTLPYRDLMKCSYDLLTDEGRLFLIIPVENIAVIEQESIFAGLFEESRCLLHTTSRKPAKRVMLSYTKHPNGQVCQSDLYIDSEEYKILTKDYYLD